MRCLGCRSFRTDASHQEELKAYLGELPAARERLLAAQPELAEWARQDASPSDQEIAALRNLVRRNDEAPTSSRPPSAPRSRRPSGWPAWRGTRSGRACPPPRALAWSRPLRRSLRSASVPDASHLLDARRLASRQKRADVLAAARAMLERGQPLHIRAIAAVRA
jgi:hypothetical protein